MRMESATLKLTMEWLWHTITARMNIAGCPSFLCFVNGELVGFSGWLSFWRIDVSELKEAMKLMGEDAGHCRFDAKQVDPKLLTTELLQASYKMALLFRLISWEDLNDDEVNALFTAVDHDGNDAISFEEFCVLARFSVIFSDIFWFFVLNLLRLCILQRSRPSKKKATARMSAFCLGLGEQCGIFLARE